MHPILCSQDKARSTFQPVMDRCVCLTVTKQLSATRDARQVHPKLKNKFGEEKVESGTRDQRRGREQRLNEEKRTSFSREQEGFACLRRHLHDHPLGQRPQSAHRAATKHVNKTLPRAKTLEGKGEGKKAHCLSSLACVVS